MVVGVGFGSVGASIAGASFEAPAGTADGVSLFEEPIPKKKKPPTRPPVTALPQIVPDTPSPVSQEVSAFRTRLAEIIEGFSQRTAAIAPPPPSTSVSQAGRLAPTILGAIPEIPAIPTPPAVPKKIAAQGATPASAVRRQRSRATSAAKPRTILTSGRGLLDLEGDESNRARKTLLGA